MAKVFIGVGHGGADPGAGSGIWREADINLTMALAMRDELERHGVTVGISRTKDENDILTEEISEANAFNPDVAVEVHNNAGGGDGWECYRQTSAAYGEQSLRLGKAIEARVLAAGQNSRGVKTKLMNTGADWFGWCRQVKAPAVLCEGFFVDNATDRADFATTAAQQAMGVAYAHGVMDYLGIAVKPVDKPAPEEPEEVQVLYTVQVGAFANELYADAYCKELQDKGIQAFVTKKK